MSIKFIDTNIFLRHLLGDQSMQSPRATEFFRTIEDRLQKARTTDTVVFEVVFTLERYYKHPKARILDTLLPLLELPGILLPGKKRLRKVFDLYVELNLPFADAYHAVLMKHLRLSEIVSFDKDFDRIPGIRRVEP